MKRWLPPILLLVFAIALLFPLLFGGKVFFFRDFGRYYAPIKAVCLRMALDKELPLWLPELNCGTPVHAELVHGLLYPVNVLLLLGESLGWGAYFAFHVLLAGLGARALARRLGADAAGALAAGIAFAGSGYLVGQLNHVPYATTAAWIPLVVLLGLQIGDGRRGSVPLLALVLGVTALAGEPFTLLLGLFLLLVLVLAGLTASRLRALVGIGVAGVLSLLLASPALIPAWDQLGESMRAAGAAPKDPLYGSVHPVRLFTLLSPEALGRQQFRFSVVVPFLGSEIEMAVPIVTNLHVGALAILAAIHAPYRSSRLARILGLVIAGGVIFALGGYLGVATILMKLPVISLFRYPDKAWMVVSLATALLLGISLPRLGRWTAVTALVLACASLAVGLAFTGVGPALLGAVPLLLCGGALLLRPELGRPALVGLLFLELLVVGLRVNNTVDPERIGSDRGLGPVLRERCRPTRLFVDLFDPSEGKLPVKEVSILTYNALDANVGIRQGFSYAFGYDPVEPSRRLSLYFGLDRSVRGLKITYLRHRLLQLVDVTHSITNSPLGPDPALEQVIYGPGGINVYAYKSPEPRARLYGRTVVAKDVWDARRMVQDVDFDPRRVLVIEGEDEPLDVEGTFGYRVRYLVDEPRHVRLQVYSEQPAWLLLTDTWDEAWSATVDGRPEPVRHGMVAFRAVPVPAGTSVVDFQYHPAWLRVVPGTFLAGLLGTLAFGMGAVFLRRREASPDAG